MYIYIFTIRLSKKYLMRLIKNVIETTQMCIVIYTILLNINILGKMNIHF